MSGDCAICLGSDYCLSFVVLLYSASFTRETHSFIQIDITLIELSKMEARGYPGCAIFNYSWRISGLYNASGETEISKTLEVNVEASLLACFRPMALPWRRWSWIWLGISITRPTCSLTRVFTHTAIHCFHSSTILFWDWVYFQRIYGFVMYGSMIYQILLFIFFVGVSCSVLTSVMVQAEASSAFKVHTYIGKPIFNIVG